MSSSPEGIYAPGVVDPGVPVPNSTNAFWQSQPSPYADYRSPWLDTADFVIVGSGITGTSIARTLYEHQPRASIVLIDARSLCSGATGRNGGHIKTRSYALWLERKELYGIDEAIRLTAFEESHLSHLSAIIRETKIDCDFVPTEGIDAYFDKALFHDAVNALDDMKQHAPDLAGAYTIYTESDKFRELKLDERCVGAIGIPAASVWPYKLVTGLQKMMIEENGLNVQTHTVVNAIEDSVGADFALVKTSRGNINARHVLHATNGWLGHLLHELRPYISPVRGNVTRQVPLLPNEPGLDSRFSYWLFHDDKDYDYLIQRADGGFVIGRANMRRRATGNDSVTDMAPIAHLRGVAAELLSNSEGPAHPAKQVRSTTPTNVTHAWSGILGFTQDGLPFVGRLPFPGRSHQWVCGGYHAMGMIKAFRTAQLAALTVLGRPIPDEYPKSGFITAERLRSLEQSLGNHEVKAKL